MSISIAYEFHCGPVHSGGTRTLEGAWLADEEMVDSLPYCVDGDTLWVLYKEIDEIVLEFKRQPE